MWSSNTSPASKYRSKQPDDAPYQNTYNYRNWEKYYSMKPEFSEYSPEIHYRGSSTKRPIPWCDEENFRYNMSKGEDGDPADVCNDKLNESLEDESISGGTKRRRKQKSTRRKKRKNT